MKRVTKHYNDDNEDSPLNKRIRRPRENRSKSRERYYKIMEQFKNSQLSPSTNQANFTNKNSQSKSKEKFPKEILDLDQTIKGQKQKIGELWSHIEVLTKTKKNLRENLDSQTNSSLVRELNRQQNKKLKELGRRSMMLERSEKKLKNLEKSLNKSQRNAISCETSKGQQQVAFLKFTRRSKSIEIEKGPKMGTKLGSVLDIKLERKRVKNLSQSRRHNKKLLKKVDELMGVFQNFKKWP
jgi:hypothetical protein